jgi:poly-gamma-glutamate capsule biosynthesis protein CapA/YwtB (metallophosphatase superfamily)
MPNPRAARRRAVLALALAAIASLAVVVLVLWGPGPGLATTPEADGASESVATTALSADQAAALAAKTPAPPPPPILRLSAPLDKPPAQVSFTVLAAGDILTHEAVNNAAWTGSGWDYSAEFEPLDPWIQGADLALCHMEVPITPSGQPTGFPMFGAPANLVTDLAEQGWNGCSTASNHSIDKRTEGLVLTLDLFDEVGMGHVGTARTEVEAASPQFYEITREGVVIRVAHLSATYGLNGLIPDTSWRVQLIDTDQIIAQATAAREQGADIVLVSLHGWVEYRTEPSTHQVEIATALADSGVVDLVIGHHAHVPQPFAMLPGGPTGNGMWVAYGLGNFISAQSAQCCAPQTEAGLLMIATFTKPYNGPAEITAMEWSAVTTDRGDAYRTYSLSELHANGSSTGSVSADTLAIRWNRVNEAVAGTAIERVTPPVPTGDEPVVVVPRPQ